MKIHELYDNSSTSAAYLAHNPALGSGPAEVVPVRIDPELRAAVAARAETDGTTTSEIIRAALRRFLDV